MSASATTGSNRLRFYSRLLRRLAVASFAFDIIWFAWLRPTFFPSPVSFNILLAQIVFILVPAVCLVSAWGLALERIVRAGDKPTTLLDRMVVVTGVIICGVMAFFGSQKLYVAILTGNIRAKRAVFDFSSSPVLFATFSMLWLVGTVAFACGIWFGIKLLRYGKQRT